MNANARPARNVFFPPQRARIAALQQHGEQRRNRPDEQRRDQQRAPHPDDPAVLGLPAKGGKKRVHRAANQADGQLSTVQFLEHAAPPFPLSPCKCITTAAKGQLRAFARRNPRPFAQFWSGDFR